MGIFFYITYLFFICLFTRALNFCLHFQDEMVWKCWMMLPKQYTRTKCYLLLLLTRWRKGRPFDFQRTSYRIEHRIIGGIQYPKFIWLHTNIILSTDKELKINCKSLSFIRTSYICFYYKNIFIYTPSFTPFYIPSICSGNKIRCF